MESENNIPWDGIFLAKIARTRMPFGKYEGVLLVHLPETYVVWFAGRGFPEGELGRMLAVIYEVKVNGLEFLFTPILAAQGSASRAT